MSKLKRLVDIDFTAKERIITSTIIGFAISFNLLFFGMLFIYITNYMSFPVILSDVLLAALIVFFPAWIIISGVLLVIPKKLYYIFASLATGGLIAAYAQGNIMNGFIDLGTLNGVPIDWSEFWVFARVTAAIWLLLILSPVILRCFTVTRIWNRVILSVCILLSAMQGASLVFEYVQNRYGLNNAPTHHLSREGLYEVSSISNIMVFVIDNLDYRFIEDIREHDETFFDRLDGFTEFTNTAATYQSTFPAATFLTTGIGYDFEQTSSQYFDYAWRNSNFINTLKDADYTMKYHMGSVGFMFTDFEQIIDVADNVRPGRLEPQILSVADNFVQLSMYRYSPTLFFKPRLWMPSASYKMSGSMPETEYVPPHNDNDPLFYRLLKENGLTIQHERPNYLYLHLWGCHSPHIMNEYSQLVPEGASDIQQAMGSFNILYSYMDEMKRLGVYDDATIIILGDHADYYVTGSYHIGLFVKPRGSSNTPLAQSDAPISFSEHTLATLFASEGFDYDYLGISVFDVPQGIPGKRTAIQFTDDTVEFMRITGHASNRDDFKIVEIRDFPLRSLFVQVGDRIMR